MIGAVVAAKIVSFLCSKFVAAEAKHVHGKLITNADRYGLLIENAEFVGDANHDVIDIVVIGICRRLEVGSRLEAELITWSDLEQARVCATNGPDRLGAFGQTVRA